MSVIKQLSIQDAVPVAAPHSGRRPLKVGVLVDLALTSEAGGHVKCWQRLAEAAVAYGDRLDLTVHFNGPKQRRIELSPSVRYVLLPPVFSTARVIRHVPDHTDLAPWHPRLAQQLAGYDVIHTTDAFFCYARTAARFARRHGVPMVSSIHTNTPEYARITTARLLERALGRGMAYRIANDELALPNVVSGLLERRLMRHLESVTFAMGSYAGTTDMRYAARHSGVALRRGLDRELFSPARRDRAWFEARFGVPSDRLILIYAGKLNAGKNVPLLVPVVQQVLQQGVPAHLFCAGSGSERDALEAALGPSGDLPGPARSRGAGARLRLGRSVPVPVDDRRVRQRRGRGAGLRPAIAVGGRQRRREPDGRLRRVCAYCRATGRRHGLRRSPSSRPRRSVAPRWGGRRAPMSKPACRAGPMSCSKTCCRSGGEPRRRARRPRITV